MSRRLIVGVTGASGAPLAWDCLTELKRHPEIETHLILTGAAEETIRYESSRTPDEFRALADVSYAETDRAAAPASGTFPCDGMLVVPCSMKTAAGIRAGYAENLLLRAADVTLKEQRKLVLCVRETPLSAIHLRNLYELSTVPGVCIVPAMMSWYSGVRTAEAMQHQITGKLLAQFGIETSNFRRWPA